MSIASIVAWLWMAAQSANVSVKINTDGDSVYRVPVMQDARPVNPPAPAEHVIEIRTKPAEPYFLIVYPANAPKVGQIMVPCGKSRKDAAGNEVQNYCWKYPVKESESR